MLKLNQTYAYLQSFIDLAHGFLIQVRDFVRQALLIDGPNLLQQDDRIPVKTVRFRVNLHMRRQLGFLNLRRNRRYDHRRTEAIADIILNDQYGPNAALLRTDDR